jgi:hypothetical protein
MSTPGRRRALRALAAAKRRNVRRVAEGKAPMVEGRRVRPGYHGIPSTRREARERLAAIAAAGSPSEKYTDPELRERVKRRVMAGARGGRPGQWSARKAQLVAQEYEAEGGGYRGRKSAAQRSLSKWTDEEWTTSTGEPSEGKLRYLPKAAWDKLSAAQVRATNAKKAAGTKRGKQFVPNTDAAASAGKRVRTGTD